MIAFDAVSDGGYSAEPYFFAHSCAGSHGALIVWGYGGADDTVTGATYDGGFMGLVEKFKPTGGDRWVYLFICFNPSLGSNNVAISGAGEMEFQAVSYTGVNFFPGGPILPDASATNSDASATVLTTSVTSTVDDCWLVMGARASGGAPAAGTGATERLSTASGLGLFDSNAGVALGLNSLEFTRGSAEALGAVLIALAPNLTPVDIIQKLRLSPGSLASLRR